MDDPNITMEEYIRLEEERARRNGKNEFPAIVYNDGLTSKLGFLTEPTISPQHIDEFNFKDETSLSKCQICFWKQVMIHLINDDDMTKDVVLDMKFCKKYATCQMIMKKFALEDEYEQIMKDE
ncbi:hypothetical protein Tco_0743271 [Tanacetum coccineum]